MKKAILYIHGKGGNAKEAEQFKDNCPGYDIIGIDYEIDFPWVVKEKIKAEYDKISRIYDSVTLIAVSIGAFFAMDTLHNERIRNALFISPILDMEKLIYDMMKWAGVSEKQLSIEKEIATQFGETLYWDYLQYVKKNPVKWNVPTQILYAGQDNLTSRSTVDEFSKKQDAKVTVMENAEHWFHTDEQIEFLDKWMKKVIC